MARTSAAKPAPAAKTTVARKTGAPAKTAASKAPAKKVAAKTTAEVKDKPKKIKLVRDSYTMPEAEYAVLGELKKACLKDGIEVKKSELLRVGVALLKRLDAAGVREVLDALPALKAGRPKKTK
jgi:hypothetical protein